MRKYLLHVFIIDLSYLVKDKAMATIPKKTIGKIKIMKKSTLLLFLFVFVLAGSVGRVFSLADADTVVLSCRCSGA